MFKLFSEVAATRLSDTPLGRDDAPTVPSRDDSGAARSDHAPDA